MIELYRGQIDAAMECTIAQLGDAWRYGHMLQRCAVTECVFSDGLQRSLTELHFDQVDAAFERLARNIFDLHADANACNFTSDLTPS